MTSKPPLEGTIEYKEGGEAPDKLARMPVALIAGSGLSPISEVQGLLRKRLQFLGLLGTSVIALVAAFIIVPVFLGESQAAAGVDFMIVRIIFILAMFTFLTGLLWSRQSLSLGQLRLIEVVAFGLVYVEIASGRFEDLASYGLAQCLQEGPPVAPPRYSTFYSLPFFILIIAYGTLIPNTWRRASVIVGLMALVAFMLAVGAALLEGMLSLQVVKALLIPLALNLSVGVALAIYGSHRIAVLEEESLAARRFGQYRLTQRLGVGGMGAVYLAEHDLLRRPCVIKLIRPERAGDPNSLRRFEREVQATATLTHPNTVQVFDYGHAKDGTFYYVMEYLPGVTLEQLVKDNGPLPPARAIHLLRQICGALQEAHAIGLIHRDIKPANVMVCERGGIHDMVKLLDFGLVIPLEGSPDNEKLTQEGTITGTPAYMSPEQAGGLDAIDPRSDIYSVGALAYFLLTRRPPFAGRSSVKTLAAHLYEAPAPLTLPGVEFSPELEEIIIKCLAKRPDDRFADAKELEAALSACATPRPPRGGIEGELAAKK